MSFFEEIYDWAPDNEYHYRVWWIDKPMWALDVLPPDPPGLCRRGRSRSQANLSTSGIPRQRF